MSRPARLTLAAAVLALSATAASAQEIYPLTNGPDGKAPNIIDSARGFIGANAVAPERELLYHPERAGDAYANYLAETRGRGEDVGPDIGPVPRRAEHRRQRQSPR